MKMYSDIASKFHYWMACKHNLQFLRRKTKLVFSYKNYNRCLIYTEIIWPVVCCKMKMIEDIQLAYTVFDDKRLQMHYTLNLFLYIS